MVKEKTKFFICLIVVMVIVPSFCIAKVPTLEEKLVEDISMALKDNYGTIYSQSSLIISRLSGILIYDE